MASFNPIPTVVTEKWVIAGKASDQNADGIYAFVFYLGLALLSCNATVAMLMDYIHARM